MSLSEWRTYIRSVVSFCPDEMGIYELVDEEKVTLYYGYGKIRSKLLSHLKREEFPQVRYFRFEKLETEEECNLRVEQLLHEYQKDFDFGMLPMYNEREKQV